MSLFRRPGAGRPVDIARRRLVWATISRPEARHWKARQIAQATELSQTAVYVHLKALVQAGYLRRPERDVWIVVIPLIDSRKGPSDDS